MKKALVIFILFSELSFSQTFDSPVVATFGGVISGYLSKQEILNTDSLTLFYRSDCRNEQYEIISFKITALWLGMHADALSDKNKLSEKQKIIIKETVVINQNLYFEDIYALKGKDTIQLYSFKIIIDGPSALLFENPIDYEYKFRPILDTTAVRYVGKIHKETGDNIKIIDFLKNDHIVVALSHRVQNEKSRLVDPRKQIVEYKISLFESDTFKEITFEVKSDEITTEIKKAIRNLNIEEIYISKIKAKDEQGNIIDIGSLRLNIEN